MAALLTLPLSPLSACSLSETLLSPSDHSPKLPLTPLHPKLPFYAQFLSIGDVARSREGLGEDISCLSVRFDVFELQNAILDLLADEMMSNLDML